MTDKVQRIRNEIKRLKNQYMSYADDFHSLGMEDKRDHYAVLASVMEAILNFIDSLQEEQEHFLEDAPATDYEVPKIEAWLAREDETDTQLGYLYLYLHKPIRAEDVGQWIGHNGVIVWNEGKYKALKWEDEPLKVSLSILGDNPKKCMFTKEDFTEEDRKILCEDCEEECEYAKKEESVSEGLEEAALMHFKDIMEYEIKTGHKMAHITSFKAGANWQKKRDNIPQEIIDAYWDFQKVGGDSVHDFISAVNGYNAHKKTVSDDLYEAAEDYAATGQILPNGKEMISFDALKAFKAGAEWKKEQIMKGATEAIVKVDAGGYPYIPQIELYDYDKDIPLAKEGEKYKVILIKEE